MKIPTSISIEIFMIILFLGTVISYSIIALPVVDNQKELQDYINNHCIEWEDNQPRLSLNVSIPFNENEEHLDKVIPLYTEEKYNYTR